MEDARVNQLKAFQGPERWLGRRGEILINFEHP